jgi:salicylate hydroxylase
MKIVIAGAGIGGLAAGLSLVRDGHEVEVIERAPELREAGAGLQLSPNAVKVLRALGVADAIAAVAATPEALEMRLGRSGLPIFSIPMGDAAVKRYGAPYLHVHRADLQTVLREAAESAGIKLRLGAGVSAYVREAGGVRLGLDTGEIASADLLVAADGIRSDIRTRMLGPDHPRFTGCVAWRLVVPGSVAPDLPNRAIVWAGKGRHAVTYRLRGGALINFVGVVETRDWREESWTAVGDKAELLADFEGWAGPVRAVIEAADICHRWALFDRDPLPHWSDGPVVLLGDACHAMPPFQAQGAAMAIEDAWVLARCIREQKADLITALRRYEALRKPRTSRVLASARANKGIFHRSNPLTQFGSYAPMKAASILLPGFVRSRQDWIYGHDVTKGDPLAAASRA